MSDIKLVVIGDSLAMHDIDNNIPTNKTYPYLIKSNFSAIDLIVRNRRANTSLQQSRNNIFMMILMHLIQIYFYFIWA